MNIASQTKRGFTLLETLIAAAVTVLVGGIGLALLNSGTILYVKNVSLNYSNIALRGVLDRIFSEAGIAEGAPVLINADGTTAGATGPAAGVRFDKYRGGPYVIVNVSGTGLAAAATSLQMQRSTHPLASPVMPDSGDVVCITGIKLRPMVSNCSVDSSSGQTQNLTVNLQAALGAAVSWDATITETAHLVHREAFIVANVNNRNEMRFYPAAETVTNYDDPSVYFVLTSDIGTQTGENTPFSIVTQNGKDFLSIGLRVQNQQFNQYLANKQKQDFNTYLRINTMLHPRNYF